MSYKESSIYGAGYHGEGPHRSTEDGKHTIHYKIWYNMLRRCYDVKWQEKNPTYKLCDVCEKWLNFQNFASWFFDNPYYQTGWDLDKDILFKNNKVYSEDTSVFVPGKINGLFVKRNKRRGEYPIGVSWRKSSSKFESYCKDSYGTKVHLGLFDTKEEAFEVYKSFKEKLIKQQAEKWKDQIDPRAYAALMNYQVEITD